MQEKGSRDAAQAAVRMVITSDRDEENALKEYYKNKNILTAATDFGGEFITSINKIIERTVLIAKKEGVISDSHPEEGSVAGAAREAVSQLMQKAIGLNIGCLLYTSRCV